MTYRTIDEQIDNPVIREGETIVIANNSSSYNGISYYAAVDINPCHEVLKLKLRQEAHIQGFDEPQVPVATMTIEVENVETLREFARLLNERADELSQG